MKFKTIISVVITVGIFCFASAASAVQTLKTYDVYAHISAPENNTIFTADYIGGFPDSHGASTLIKHSGKIEYANWYNEAYAYAYARDEIGNLGFNLQIHANTSEGYDAYAKASASAEFDDFVTVVSKGDLPLGTPVQIELFHEISYETDYWFWLGNTSASITITHDFKSEWTVSSSDGDYFKALHTTDDISFPYGYHKGTLSDSILINTFVGETITVSDEMKAFTEGYAKIEFDDNEFFVHDASFGGFIDAKNSAHTYMAVLTPGVQLISDSGHDYSLPTPVPEPETFAMLLAGLGLLGFMARHRKISSYDLNV